MSEERSLCDVYREVVSKDECVCQCLTSRNTQCKNVHKFKYVLSNGEEYLTCSVIKHRRFVMQRCVSNVSATISQLIYKVDRDDDRCLLEYKVIALNADKYNDVECPIVSNCIPPRTMKTLIKENLLRNQEHEHNIKKTISALQKIIMDEEKKLIKHSRINNEYKNALHHMKFHSEYRPNQKKLKIKDGEICAICYESLNSDPSSVLYECNHIFHNGCIQRWFRHKDVLTCPYCREVCDADRYFVYSRYTPLRS